MVTCCKSLLTEKLADRRALEVDDLDEEVVGPKENAIEEDLEAAVEELVDVVGAVTATS